MFLLVNIKTKEKIFLEGSTNYIGTYSNANIKIKFTSDLMILLQEEREKIVLIKKLGNILVNNKPILRKILEDGDQIVIGNENYLFMVEENLEQIKTNVSPPFLFLEGDTDQESQNFIKSLMALNNFSQKISSILDFGTLLNVVIELAISIIKTEKGFILLYDNNLENLTIKSTINLEKEIGEETRLEQIISSKVIESLKTEKSIIINNISLNEYPTIKNVIVARLKTHNSIIGYICLINKINHENISTKNSFSNHDKYLIESLSTQAAICIDNAHLYEKIKTETDLRNNLLRYLPRDIVSKVMDSKINLSLIGEMQECSILFADICGFTSISEKLNPKEIVKLLNSYLTIMTKVIFSFNGSVDKFIGDGLMAVFGAPITNPNHALEATMAAVEMKNELESLKEKFFVEFGIKDFTIRIGINTGVAVYGNVGSPQRMDFTVIGDCVNVASRMEKSAPSGGILISQNTYNKVKEYVNAKECQAIIFKGKKEPIKVYEVLDQEKISIIDSSIDNSVRMYSRIQLKTFVSIIKGNFRSNGLIRDISTGGVSIGTVGSYNPGDIVTMTFKLNNNITFRNIKGIVKHIERSMFEAITMGVEFVDFSDERLKELVDFIDAETK